MKLKAFVSLLSLVAAFAQAAEPITAERLWHVARPGALQLSPDQSQIAFTVTRYDLDTDKANADIHVLNLRTNQVSPLTSHPDSDTNPIWSPTGQHLAFLSKRGFEQNQLFVIPLAGGEAKAITKLPVAAQQPQWFPDGQHLLFLASVPKNFNGDFGALEAQLQRQKNSLVSAKVTENRVYRYWDQWLTDEFYPHLFRVNALSGEITDLTPGWNRWFSLGSASFSLSPDGRTIALSANTTSAPFDRLNQDILLLKTDGSGQFTNLTAHNPANDTHPLFSKDGKYLYYGAQKSTTFSSDNVQLMRAELASGKKENLTAQLDLSIDSWQLDASGQTLYFSAADKAKTALYSLATAPGSQNKVQQIFHQGTSDYLQVSSGQRLYFVHHSQTQLPELYSLDNKGRTLTQLTRLNADLQEQFAWGKVENISFPGFEGKQVQAFITYPPHFDAGKKWPLLNLLHGGPHSHNSDSFGYRWNPQVFAAKGYVVIQPNFHGSTSFGQAFAESIHGDHATKPFADSDAAVDYMISRGFIDETRLAAGGGSYGGYLISWIAGHSDRYKALVNHAGVYNLMSQFASDLTTHRVNAYGASPWSNLEQLQKINPALHADKFVTPMLILHGEKDYRVPATQGLEIYGVLKGKGIDSRLVYFPNENHWILKPNNSVFWYQEFIKWLERYAPAGPVE